MNPVLIRVEEEMMIRGYSPKSIEAYRGRLRAFFGFFKGAPGEVTLEDVRRFQLYLVRERKVSASTVNQTVAAIKFCYQEVLKVQWALTQIPHCKGNRRLPVVLSRQETRQLLASSTNLKHRAILTTIYSAGLRLDEARQLKVTDIDSQRMTLRIEQGKGRKDRYVPLSKELLPLLRQYWCQHRPRSCLFEGGQANQPMCPTSLQRMFEKARVVAGIRKPVSLHSLRHSFATHFLENGGNILVLKELMGHTSLKTTQVYLHLSADFLEKTRSPLDAFDSPSATPLEN